MSTQLANLRQKLRQHPASNPMNPLLPALFGSRSLARVLLFLQNCDEGHARRIAITFDAPHRAIQRQRPRRTGKPL